MVPCRRPDRAGNHLSVAHAPKESRMSYRPYQEIIRRKSRRIYVGKVPVGDGAPITVQTMTNTLTTDVAGTVAQIKLAEAAGVDIVRVSCPDRESALALKDIVAQVNVPIVADIHFHYKRALEAAASGAACLRINPGNIGSDERVREVIKAARDHGCSMRIGVNAGSLEKHLLEKYGEPNPEALVESALYHADILQQHDFHDFKISVKASDVFLAVAAYQQLAEVCDHPLHIGITEAGGRRMGTVKSSIGLGSLLWAGIGDTLRVSLSDEPEEEVRVGWDMLKTLGIRHRGVKVISCPSCARQGYNVIETVRTLEDRLGHIETPLTLSIIGCVVNGPGEALLTDIGVTGGGNGRHMIYAAGKTDHTIDGASMVDHIVALVEAKAASLQAAQEASLQAAQEASLQAALEAEKIAAE
jgi:(E)-4-hydroxy-3-methylbut-2-enyl-diphosphate synthase